MIHYTLISFELNKNIFGGSSAKIRDIGTVTKCDIVLWKDTVVWYFFLSYITKRMHRLRWFNIWCGLQYNFEANSVYLVIHMCSLLPNCIIKSNGSIRTIPREWAQWLSVLGELAIFTLYTQQVQTVTNKQNYFKIFWSGRKVPRRRKHSLNKMWKDGRK